MICVHVQHNHNKKDMTMAASSSAMEPLIDLERNVVPVERQDGIEVVRNVVQYNQFIQNRNIFICVSAVLSVFVLLTTTIETVEFLRGMKMHEAPAPVASYFTGQLVPAVIDPPEALKSCLMVPDGRALDVKSHPKLCASLHVFGSNSEQCYLPDLRDKFLLASGRLFKAGQIGGEIAHSLTSSENGPHMHNIEDPGHSHSNSLYGRPFKVTGSDLALTHVSTRAAPTDIPSSKSYTNIDMSASGEGSAHNNMPPYATIPWYIYGC